MDISNTLTVIGIIVSVIFGAWGVIVTFRARAFGEITFFVERTIALVDSIAGRIPELSIFYRRNPASINLVLLRGTFVNTGTRDIAPNMVETPLSMQLPEGYFWLHSDIVSTSPDVKASISIEGDNHIFIKTGLIRPGEFIRMEALATLPEQIASSKQKGSREKSLLQNLAFTHRIANVSKIKSRKPPEKPVSRWKWLLTFIPGTLIFCVITFVGLAILSGTSSNKLVFPYSSPNNSIIFVEVKPKNAKVVEVKAIDNSFKKELPYESFLSQLKGVPIIKHSEAKISAFAKVFGSIIIGLSILFGLLALYEEVRARQYQIRIYKTYINDAAP
jgi:hypothetical protein